MLGVVSQQSFQGLLQEIPTGQTVPPFLSIPDSPQQAHANWPQIAPVIPASSPTLTARRTASRKSLALAKDHKAASRLRTTWKGLV